MGEGKLAEGWLGASILLMKKIRLSFWRGPSSQSAPRDCKGSIMLQEREGVGFRHEVQQREVSPFNAAPFREEEVTEHRCNNSTNGRKS